MRSRLSALLVILALVLAGCGDDDEGSAAASSSSTSTPPATEPAPEDTEAEDTDPDDEGEADQCPNEAPIPDGATEVTTGSVAFSTNGSEDDVLSVYQYEDSWWVHAEWADGGTSAVPIEEASMGARALGGFDLDGDGTDEAFVAVSGPASGSLVAIFWRDGCDLAPVVDADSAMAFAFPVTASVGVFSGATCESIGDLSLITGELMDAEAGEYEAQEVPYSYDPATGELTAGFGDGGSATFDEVGQLASLNCGELGNAL